MNLPPFVEYIEAAIGEAASRAVYRYLALFVLASIVSALLFPFAWRDLVRTGIVVGLLLYAAIDIPSTIAHIWAEKSGKAFDRTDKME